MQNRVNTALLSASDKRMIHPAKLELAVSTRAAETWEMALTPCRRGSRSSTEQEHCAGHRADAAVLLLSGCNY